MWSASDIWHLFKLAIKTVTFFVIFGTLGWALYTSPSGIPKPPSTEAELREWAEDMLSKERLSEGDGRRQDILNPFVEAGQDLRRIWGPWENAENRTSWTAYDEAYAERLGMEIRQAMKQGEVVSEGPNVVFSPEDLKRDPRVIDRIIVKRITDLRERSERFCAELERPWLDMERKKAERALDVDGIIRLGNMRKQQAECRYWQSQLKQGGGS